MITLNGPVAKRIAKLFRSLSSDFDGEILGAVAAMKTAIRGRRAKLPRHRHGDRELQRRNRESQLQRRRRQGHFRAWHSKGRAEQQDINLEFYDGEGRPRSYDMAVFCQRNAGSSAARGKSSSPTSLARCSEVRRAQSRQGASSRFSSSWEGYCDPKIQAAYFQQ